MSNRRPTTMKALRLFIGYDSREPVAYHVLANSILRQATSPVAITPLTRNLLGSLYTRERTSLEATEFSFTRFLVPYLSDYQGLSMFMDCDMLVRADIAELVGLVERLAANSARHAYLGTGPVHAVYCCQHDYTPRAGLKMEGQVQTVYPRKNWSSLMVFNNHECRALTPYAVNTESGLFLHRFQWLEPDQVSALPLEWNWLVGEYAPNPDAKVLHYTLGGPWFPNTADCDHADLWLEEYRQTTGQTWRPTISETVR